MHRDDLALAQVEHIAAVLQLVRTADGDDVVALKLDELAKLHPLPRQLVLPVGVTRKLVHQPPRGALAADHLLQHDAARVADDAKAAVQVHAVLVLLKVVPDHRQATAAQQVLLHQLLRRLHVGAKADAQKSEVAAGGNEVAALQESGRLDLAHHLHTDLEHHVLHQLHLVLALLRAETRHDDAAAGGNLLVAGIDEVGEGAEGVGGGHAGVAPAVSDVDDGAGEDGVDDLRHAHTLDHLTFVVIAQVKLVLLRPGRQVRARSLVLQAAHGQLLQLDASAEVLVHAHRQDLLHSAHLEAVGGEYFPEVTVLLGSLVEVDGFLEKRGARV
mmetsp:Transcript_217/g.370  ORF Transcript_217/g.370 Transcript_217/m.370 type:complete len:329 (-) Transcript_217:405-1391(-)